MSPKVAKILARALIGLAVVMCLATIAASAATVGHPVTAPIVIGDPHVADGPAVLAHLRASIHRGDLSKPGLDPGTVLVLVLALVWMVTGSLIVSRQPRNFAGWLLITVSMGWVLTTAGTALLGWSLIAGRTLPLRGVAAVAGEFGLAPVLLLPLLFLLFPNGRPPPRWRFLVWTILGGFALWTVGYVLSPGPLNNFVDNGILYVSPLGVRAIAGITSVLNPIGGVMVLVSAIATVPAVRGRYKRSNGEERQQLRWLVAVGTLTGSLLAAFILLIVVLAPLGWGESRLSAAIQTMIWITMALAIAVGIPGAYLVAILKHGLWDLDVVIKKARVALVLTLLIVLPTVLLIAIASQVLLWEFASKIQTLAGGVVVGLLLVPLIRWGRRMARRITFGKRSTPYEVLTEFSGRVGETYATDDVLPRMAQILVAGTGAVSAPVLLRVGTGVREEAAFGPAGSGGEHTVPVLHHGDELGALAVTMPASDPMNPAKERLTFSVTDDGKGVDPSGTDYGTGLQGMADRLDAMGGDLRVKSRPGAGTSVTGTLPATPAEVGA